MSQNLKKLFKNLKDHSPTTELSGKILLAIKAQKERSIRSKIMLTYAGFASSVALLAFAVYAFGQSFLQSEFWSLLSLSISDAGTVMKYGGDYVFSLLETFPVAIAIIFLTPILLLLLSLASYFHLNNSNHFKHV